jgi:hypothetical protein
VQEYKGRLNFATDTWTSPSHHTYMAVTVHLEFNGDTVALVLDIIEVPEASHFTLSLIKGGNITERMIVT